MKRHHFSEIRPIALDPHVAEVEGLAAHLSERSAIEQKEKQTHEAHAVTPMPT